MTTPPQPTPIPVVAFLAKIDLLERGVITLAELRSWFVNRRWDAAWFNYPETAPYGWAIETMLCFEMDDYPPESLSEAATDLRACIATVEQREHAYQP